MKRTSVTVTVGALLIAGTALVAPAQAHALAARQHAPSVVVPAAPHATVALPAKVVRPAATSDQTQIRQAILHSQLLGAVRPSDVAVSDVRFAGPGKTWAGALVTPKDGQTDPAQVLLRKSGTTWQVRDLGTASVGCGIAPSSVRNTLGLHGTC